MVIMYSGHTHHHRRIWMHLLGGRGVGGGEQCPNDPNQYYKKAFCPK